MPKGSSSKKGSPGKGSPKKGSPKKGSPGSKKDKSSKKSPNKKRSPDKAIKEIPPIILRNVRRKLVWTGEGWPDYVFKEFRCPVCRLVLDSFPQFIAHACWRKYYTARFHLGETQAFGCRTCNQMFYSHADYATHECNDHKLCYTRKYREVEEVIPIDYPDHFDFYIAWARRTDWENKPHDPDWQFKIRCSKCSNKFKDNILYMLHSCFQFALLKPAATRRLKTCIHCRYVFLDEAQYENHLPYCRLDRAFCIDLNLTLTEVACQQFVLGRHCYEFNYHLHHGACFKQRAPGEPPGGPALPPTPIPPGPSISVNCFICGFIQPNLVEFLYHPCVAGKLITPAHLELILFCNDCHCLFTSMEDCIEHMKSCCSLIFTFVRFNTEQLIRLALKRWTLEIAANVYLPARQVKFQCGACKELFRTFPVFLSHPCPKHERYERIFLQPMALLETYVCHACHLVVFSASEAVSHSAYCKMGEQPTMIQVHYNMDEVVLALTPWMRGPQLLEFDVNMGLGDMDEELTYRAEEARVAMGLPTLDMVNKYKGANRVGCRVARYIDSRIEKVKRETRQMLGAETLKLTLHKDASDTFDESSSKVILGAKFSLPPVDTATMRSEKLSPRMHWSATIC